MFHVIPRGNTWFYKLHLLHLAYCYKSLYVLNFSRISWDQIITALQFSQMAQLKHRFELQNNWSC